MAERENLIDLRSVTPETFPTLGNPAPWRWQYKKKPKDPPLKAVTLKENAEVILVSGEIAHLVKGDDIVQTNDKPPLYGYISYAAHELQTNFKPVHVAEDNQAQ